MSIRPATATDCDALVRVHSASWSVGFRGLIPDEFTHGWTPGDSRQQVEKVLSQPAWRTFVHERSGLIEGFVTIAPDQEAPPRAAWGELRMLYVDPPSWGGGAAEALTRKALEELAAGGVRQVYLLVLPGNARGRRFYEKMGFRLMDEDEREIEFRGHLLPHVVYARAIG